MNMPYISGNKIDRGWPDAVIFDLDGTLVDSSADLTSSLNDLLAECQQAPFSREETLRFVGGGIAVLVQRALKARGVERDAQGLSATVARYQSIYEARLTETTRLYDGALDVLVSLKSRGVKIAICTNKTENLASGIVKGLGFAGHIDAVIAGCATRALKPSPVPLFDALTYLGITSGDAIMVGDSITDVTCARAAGIPVICVSFGYSHIPARDLGADAVIDHYAEFDDACSRCVSL